MTAGGDGIVDRQLVMTDHSNPDFCIEVLVTQLLAAPLQVRLGNVGECNTFDVALVLEAATDVSSAYPARADNRKPNLAADGTTHFFPAR